MGGTSPLSFLAFSSPRPWLHVPVSASLIALEPFLADEIIKHSSYYLIKWQELSDHSSNNNNNNNNKNNDNNNNKT